MSCLFPLATISTWTVRNDQDDKVQHVCCSPSPAHETCQRILVGRGHWELRPKKTTGVGATALLSTISTMSSSHTNLGTQNGIHHPANSISLWVLCIHHTHQPGTKYSKTSSLRQGGLHLSALTPSLPDNQQVCAWHKVYHWPSYTHRILRCS